MMHFTKTKKEKKKIKKEKKKKIDNCVIIHRLRNCSVQINTVNWSQNEVCSLFNYKKVYDEEEEEQRNKKPLLWYEY